MASRGNRLRARIEVARVEAARTGRTARKLRAVLTLAVLLLLVSPAGAQESGQSDTADKDTTGIRFARADLVDVAMYVSEKTGKGFVLANPELRGISMSLYHPGALNDTQLTAMFQAALESYGLRAEDRGDFWMISPAMARDGNSVMIDFRGVEIGAVSEMMAHITGKHFVIADQISDLRITIRAAGPVTATEALKLFEAAVVADGLTMTVDGDTVVVSEASDVEGDTAFLDNLSDKAKETASGF